MVVVIRTPYEGSVQLSNVNECLKKVAESCSQACNINKVMLLAKYLSELNGKGGALGGAGSALLSVPQKDNSSPWLSNLGAGELQPSLGFSTAERCTPPCAALTNS